MQPKRRAAFEIITRTHWIPSYPQYPISTVRFQRWFVPLAVAFQLQQKVQPGSCVYRLVDSKAINFTPQRQLRIRVIHSYTHALQKAHTNTEPTLTAHSEFSQKLEIRLESKNLIIDFIILDRSTLVNKNSFESITNILV